MTVAVGNALRLVVGLLLAGIAPGRRLLVLEDGV